MWIFTSAPDFESRVAKMHKHILQIIAQADVLQIEGNVKTWNHLI